MAAEARQQQALAADMMAAAERLKMLAEDRLRVGARAEAEADVAAARANLQGCIDNAAQVDYGLAQLRRALEMLLGRYPAPEIAVPSVLLVLLVLLVLPPFTFEQQ